MKKTSEGIAVDQRQSFYNTLGKLADIQKKQCEILEAKGLKVIATGLDWIDWEREDGLKYRSWDYEWVRYIPVFDYKGKSGPHNCMRHCFCEVCGLDCSE